jgi:uncharacterized protein YjbJ (UPF0337 family)
MNADDKPEDKPEPEVQELKGHVEETAGTAAGDDDLVAHGKADQIAAHAKQAAAQAGEAAKHLGQRVKEGAMHKLGELHERLHEAADKSAQEKKDQEKKDPDK